MKIILTGGMGFIGSCLLKGLNEEGYTDIIIVDTPAPEKEKNIAGKRFKDVIEKNKFLYLVKDGKMELPDSMIHFGACSSTINYDVEHMFFNNYYYSVTLAKWILYGGKRFLYASSAATYGAGENGFSDEDEETKKLKPLNIYGLSKHLFDLWIIANGFVDKVTGFKFLMSLVLMNIIRVKCAVLLLRRMRRYKRREEKNFLSRINWAYGTESRRGTLFILRMWWMWRCFFLTILKDMGYTIQGQGKRGVLMTL